MTPCLPGRTLREKSKVYERGVSEAPRTHTGTRTPYSVLSGFALQRFGFRVAG